MPIEYPPVNYELCPRKWYRKMAGGICIHQGLMGYFGKCTVLHGLTCLPIKQYKKDLAALRKKQKGENHETK